VSDTFYKYLNNFWSSTLGSKSNDNLVSINIIDASFGKKHLEFCFN